MATSTYCLQRERDIRILGSGRKGARDMARRRALARYMRDFFRGERCKGGW